MSLRSAVYQYQYFHIFIHIFHSCLRLWLQLAGLALVVVGVWFLADKNAIHFLDVASDHGTSKLVQAAAITVLIVGFITAVIGLVGCWGACRQKVALLNIVSSFFIHSLAYLSSSALTLNNIGITSL